MNNLQTILKQFQKDYEEAYDGILSKEVLEKGNPWFEERLKQAYLAGAEEHAREIQIPIKWSDSPEPIATEQAYNQALQDVANKSRKALQQIKDTVV